MPWIISTVFAAADRLFLNNARFLGCKNAGAAEVQALAKRSTRPDNMEWFETGDGDVALVCMLRGDWV